METIFVKKGIFSGFSNFGYGMTEIIKRDENRNFVQPLCNTYRCIV